VRRAPLIALALALLAAPAGWWASDRLEANDAFCTSCHLPSGAPLHARKLADFGARPAATLAAAHAAAGRPAHGGAFRCIDCHGGTGFAGRARVKALTLRDGALYVAARFGEPRTMDWPLEDADCRKCHVEFPAAPAASTEGGATRPGFHTLAIHNRELGVRCVTCHAAHEPGGLADHHFLHPETVRATCVRCHPEFAEGTP
jgi:hypothetical protein